MEKRSITSRLIITLVAATFAACSSQSPVAPSPLTAVGGDLSAKPSAAVPGVYDLSFTAWVGGVLQPVASLPVSSAELILRAYVTDSSGSPAAKGRVTFEYCSYKGGPPNDITRADEAPMEACQDGQASWARLDSVPIGSAFCPSAGAGYACFNFGIVGIPRVVGFRIRYEPQGSGIAAGMTVPENFTWVEAS
jgi:hypothetical protein